MNIFQISENFPTEESVTDYFEFVRWGKNTRCSHCGSDRISKRYADFRYYCNNCECRFSVTVGTSLENTNLSLRKWLFAFALITDAKKGISALQLHRNLGVNYRTAWSMYHKIREFMSDGNIILKGIVEIDETYIGGKPRKYQSAKFKDKEPFAHQYLDEKLAKIGEKHSFENPNAYKKKGLIENAPRGRGTSKIPVVGIVSRSGNVVAEVMQVTDFAHIRPMVEQYVNMPDSVLLTDAYKAYDRFDAIMERIVIDHDKMYSYKGLNTNSIESFWAIIKRGIIGQYHSVSEKYLPNYIDEFCFKYNNRKFDDMFETLVFNSMLPLDFTPKQVDSKMINVRIGKKRAKSGNLVGS
ncbi:transposase-like zinc ribbon protein [Arcicella aurantiaca]|uniref:Transposase-like zinc ribbon protein n=1 Tax=Arcicella aurantiaca TaxID=591202 RepID=A0A316DG30_9BACT|nr:IS1595 family transposase [Arcicella aurantiaca]PWK17064.1 transposase-like zinc ribbon protein [Arcicella aurantiaca]